MAFVEFTIPEYDFAATLDGGQAFRWRAIGVGWEAVVDGRWVRLVPICSTLQVSTAVPVTDWSWLRHYLALDEDLPAILETFPRDGVMPTAVQAVPGLRLLRQDPWECLASFILSSTKQIVQIQECVRLLCEKFGEVIPAGPEGSAQAWAFPHFHRLAAATETELRACKLGFRAKYLGGTARMLAAGEVSLERIAGLPTPMAREELQRFPGVGRKIADCVLLFAFQRQDAFPVDVWVQQALRHLYFPKSKQVTPARLVRFSETHFGVNTGYAQQYLFHYARTVLGRRWSLEQRRRMKRPRRKPV